MRIKYLFWMFFALILAEACSNESVEQGKGDIAPPNQDEEPLDGFLMHYESLFKTHFNATGCPAAAIVIVQDTSVIYMKGFGVRKKGTNDSVDVNTIFRIGSLSKGFSSVLVAILVEKGLLSYEDRIVDIIPEFRLKDKEQTERIRVKHLLSHSTGLPRHTFTDLIEDGQTISQIIPKLEKVGLTGKEGVTYAYQNLAFAIIEEVIRRKTGEEFTDLLRKEIFVPAGMNSASANYAGIKNAANKAMPYERNQSRKYEELPVENSYYNAPSVGGINASIADMGQWLRVLMGARSDIISPEALDIIFTPMIESSDGEYFDQWDGVKKSYYGMGWRILDFGDRKIFYHGGLVNAFRSEIAIDKTNRIAICILFSAESSYPRIATPTFLNYFDLYRNLTNSNSAAKRQQQNAGQGPRND